jgi:hypothetical protein
MILKRCPSCRGFCDVERGVRCFACGAVLSDNLPTLTRRPPPALRRAQTDKKSSVTLLTFLAVFGILGVALLVIPPALDPLPRAGLGAFVVIALGLGSFARSTPAGSASRIVSKGMFTLLACVGGLVAMIIGLFLLLLLACSVGMLGGSFH